MQLLTPHEALVLLGAFAALMLCVVWRRSADDRAAEGFLVASRDVSLGAGAFSIAVSWIWAPAIFICSMQAYTLGLPGIFWFTVPNIVCFFVFAPLAIRMRRMMPDGYTVPELVARRFRGHRGAHIALLTVFFGYQLGAIVINCLAGGALLHAISGIDVRLAIVGMSLTAISYSLLGGLRASVLTDILQMIMILVVAFLLVPWCIVEAGGLRVLWEGLGGVGGGYRHLLDPWIAYSMGIPMTLGLIAGPISDQMFVQRAMAVRSRSVVKVFVLGGLLFGVVPITLALLGFLGASPSVAADLSVADSQVVGAFVVGYLLPRWALLLFCVMAFAGLASTLDSAYCALSALGSIDVYRRYLRPDADGGRLLSAARSTMLVMALLGTSIALLQPRLLWVFLIYGALASAGMFPIILSLYWPRLGPNGVVWGVALSLALGTPMSIVANVLGSPHLIVAAALVSVCISLVVCLVTGWLYRGEGFDLLSLERRRAELEGEEEVRPR